jgi:hypothetical protein
MPVPIWIQHLFDIAPAVESTGAGWKTLLDVDFKAASSQALHTDGTTASIGGVTWTKSGSALDGTTYPWAIVNGTGLRTSCASGLSSDQNSFDTGYLTYPTLWPNLALCTLTGLETPSVRISAIYGAIADANDGNSVGIALEARDSANRNIAFHRRAIYSNAFYQSAVAVSCQGASVSAIIDNAYNEGESPLQNAVSLLCPNGLLQGPFSGWTANAATNVFPARSAFRCRGITPAVAGALSNFHDAPAVWTPDNWRCSIINGQGDAASICWVTRFKVEAFF